MRLASLLIPGLVTRSSWYRSLQSRDAAPYGALEMPRGNDVWNNTDGFGLGRVIYQGVDVNFTLGDITHVTTFAIDIFLQADDDSGATYYLAKGIAAQNTMVDKDFQIPNFITGPGLIPWCVTIEEISQRTTAYGPVSYASRTAAPQIEIAPPSSTLVVTTAGVNSTVSTPWGTLQEPSNGTSWTNNDGFGVGRVLYLGVAQDHGNVSVTTHSIDIYLQLANSSESPYYLARGIAPTNGVIDAQFQVPGLISEGTASYYLVIDETQLLVNAGRTTTYVIPNAGLSAINITLPPSPTPAAETFSGSPHPLHTALVIAGGIIGGVVALIAGAVGLIVLLLRKCTRQNRVDLADGTETTIPWMPSQERLAIIPTQAEPSEVTQLPAYRERSSPCPPAISGRPANAVNARQDSKRTWRLRSNLAQHTSLGAGGAELPQP